VIGRRSNDRPRTFFSSPYRQRGALLFSILESRGPSPPLPLPFPPLGESDENRPWPPFPPSQLYVLSPSIKCRPLDCSSALVSSEFTPLSSLIRRLRSARDPLYLFSPKSRPAFPLDSGHALFLAQWGTASPISAGFSVISSAPPPLRLFTLLAHIITIDSAFFPPHARSGRFRVTPHSGCFPGAIEPLIPFFFVEFALTP